MIAAHNFHVTVSVILLSSIGQIFSQFIVSSLANYQKVSGISVSGISATSFSGVAFHPGSKTLYAVDDANTTVYELSTSGALLRSITLTGFEDTEGIAYRSGDFFYIVEERRANVVLARILQTGNGPVYWDSCSALNIGQNWDNSGLEDVSWCGSTNTAYAVKEQLPPRLYKINLDTNGVPVGFNENNPFNIEGNPGDAAGLYVFNDNSLILLSQEENKLMGYTGTGDMVSELILNMTKPEGVTVDLEDSAIYVVGEPREFYVFKKKQNALLMPDLHEHPPCMVVNRTVHSSSPCIGAYNLSTDTYVRIEIFSTAGKRIACLVDKKINHGTHRIVWQANNMYAGLYIIMLKTTGFTEAKTLAVF